MSRISYAAKTNTQSLKDYLKKVRDDEEENETLGDEDFLKHKEKKNENNYNNFFNSIKCCCNNSSGTDGKHISLRRFHNCAYWTYDYCLLTNKRIKIFL